MMKVVGLIPAAGRATRLSTLPCSKELFPIGGNFTPIDGVQQYRPKPVAKYLIERMVLAKAQQIIFIISRDKFDILRYFGSGQEHGTNISYMVQEQAKGMPDALNSA